MSKPRSDGKKILVIDDEVLVRETVKLALVHEGFQVFTLDDPVKAKDRIRELAPDLVILDIYMPGLNGLDICRWLKAEPECRHIPVLIFTGSNQTIDVMSSIEAGAFEYVAKPVDGGVLVAKIRALFEKHAR